MFSILCLSMHGGCWRDRTLFTWSIETLCAHYLSLSHHPAWLLIFRLRCDFLFSLRRAFTELKKWLVWRWKQYKIQCTGILAGLALCIQARLNLYSSSFLPPVAWLGEETQQVHWTQEQGIIIHSDTVCFRLSLSPYNRNLNESQESINKLSSVSGMERGVESPLIKIWFYFSLWQMRTGKERL